ncbi:MAG: hypothetical protein ABSE17_03915 [Candidatus Levyibacteriota bacterium]|jgi:transposase-like protein
MEKTGKKILKLQMRALVTTQPKVTQTRMCELFGVSRPTIRKWLDEVREEQLAKIDQQSLRTEIWRMQERAREYLIRLEELDAETKQRFYYDRPVSAILRMIQLSWEIEKDLFKLRLDLYSAENSKANLNIGTIDQRIGIGMMNVANT